jgi:diguanylate cyclase (GGDEF)-like protein
MSESQDLATKWGCLAAVLDLMPLGACILDRDLTVRAWNRVLVEWTGIPREEALGMDLEDRFPNLRADRFRGRLRQVFEEGVPAVFSSAIHRHFLPVAARHGPPGTPMVQETRARLLPGDSSLALLTLQDVTSESLQLADLRRERARLVAAQSSLERVNEQLAEMAATDALTGAKNYRHFHEALEAAISFAMRRGLSLSLVMLDVDRFKAYNDAHGHPAGDQALRAVAAILRASSRLYDTVARYGGEEFVVLLPATDAVPARIHAERLRAAIEGHAWPLRPVTASFGVATMTPCTATASVLLDSADRALYRSKRRGRNCVTHVDDLALTPEGPLGASPDRLWSGARS